MAKTDLRRELDFKHENFAAGPSIGHPVRSGMPRARRLKGGLAYGAPFASEGLGRLMQWSNRQIGASGKVGIRHHAAVLPDHCKKTADRGRTEIRAAWHDGINQAGEPGETNREANDNIKKLAGSLLPGSLPRYMFHAWKLLKIRGQRQCRNVKNNPTPPRFPKGLALCHAALPAICSNVITYMTYRRHRELP
jgi:hypothetical protein